MKLVSLSLRAVATATVLLLSPAAFAGDAEVAFLHSLAGEWQGSGNVSGPEGGNVSCRVVMKPSGSRLSYNGRCAAPGATGSQSFSGRITYSDQRRRFESSSGTVTVAGQLSGSTLTFVTERSTIQGDISSTMVVSPRSMKMQFRSVSKDGATHQGTIPFSKI